MTDMQYIIHTPIETDAVAAGSVLHAACTMGAGGLMARIRRQKGLSPGDLLSIKNQKYVINRIQADGRTHLKIDAHETE
jgi:hypothetical protein